MERTKAWDLSPPHGYVARAKSFAAAARLLHQHHTSDFTPYLFCVGHATEVALKGFLVLKGVKESTFPRNPGHNLVQAWRLAVSHGAPISVDPPQWCELMAVAHAAPYDSRYPRSTLLMGLPAPSIALDGIDSLISTIETEMFK